MCPRVCLVVLSLALLGSACDGGSEQTANATESSKTARVGNPSDWCREHALPESKCTKCNPELTAKFKDRGDWCAEHGFPESVCPLCHPMQPPPGMERLDPPQTEATLEPGTRIRFRSPRIERAAGIQTVKARKAVVGEGVECPARIEFDRDRVADVRAPMQGIVRDVRVELGAEVRKGEPLFVLESPEVADLQGSLRASRERVTTARAQYERVQKLQADGIASQRRLDRTRQELEEAKAKARAAESTLRMSGASGRHDSGRFVLRAPMPGTVVHRPATMGTFATAETSLATIADPSEMWALLDVREDEASAVRRGQTATVTIDGLEGRSFSGEVRWIAPEVDPRTRTVRVRVELDNPQGLLRANQFGRAVVQVERGEKAVAVPRSAVQRVGDKSVVFVRTGEGVYEPRSVRLGRAQDDLVQVWGSVDDGAPVATGGAFLLKTELQSDSIGAGCCEVEPPSGR